MSSRTALGTGPQTPIDLLGQGTRLALCGSAANCLWIYPWKIIGIFFEKIKLIRGCLHAFCWKTYIENYYFR